ncbi:uncharacterized protein B0H18DRAFT_1113329 [Fomitopsis serialis]|uniref:uncharacterized protein n=1 Tax=Fomitopsis serialis TaxID=139415 RepID=UPI0020078E8C|nr:uncharacterized protein B0H18DRAFT_1113329 [Neoantrodia serialis]KAH9937504.1 hypothetical protein B0H18DRAFT_1113329 [Neoantrodia serialis]
MVSKEYQQQSTQLFRGNGPKIEPMRVVDVPKAVEDAIVANEDDPWHRYKCGYPVDAGKRTVFPLQMRSAIYLGWLDAIRRREHWTINRGESILVYSAAENSLSPWQRAINNVAGAITKRLLAVFTYFKTKEQQKRDKEAHEKEQAVVAKHLGDRVANLISLDNLATAVKAQRKGYASALVRHLTDLADKQGRGVWLFTHESTVGFYARLGFERVSHFVVGDNNPTWTEKPVVMCMMLREPKTDSPLLEGDLKAELS